MAVRSPLPQPRSSTRSPSRSGVVAEEAVVEGAVVGGVGGVRRPVPGRHELALRSGYGSRSLGFNSCHVDILHTAAPVGRGFPPVDRAGPGSSTPRPTGSPRPASSRWWVPSPGCATWPLRPASPPPPSTTSSRRAGTAADSRLATAALGHAPLATRPTTGARRRRPVRRPGRGAPVARRRRAAALPPRRRGGRRGRGARGPPRRRRPPPRGRDRARGAAPRSSSPSPTACGSDRFAHRRRGGLGGSRRPPRRAVHRASPRSLRARHLTCPHRYEGFRRPTQRAVEGGFATCPLRAQPIEVGRRLTREMTTPAPSTCRACDRIAVIGQPATFLEFRSAIASPSAAAPRNRGRPAI